MSGAETTADTPGAGGAMRFGILGPLAVERDGRPLDLGRYKQRALLIALLVDANDVVPVDRLLEWLWPGDHAPAAAATLHSYVSRLRRSLEPERAPRATASLLVTRPPGYLLRVDPDQVDALRFKRLAEQGQLALERGDPGQGSVLLREALGLWRGRALADVVFEEAARPEVTRLETLRLGAVANRIDADLALGRHLEVVAELRQLVAEQPLHERFRAQLMLALYRSGQQAEALEQYRQGREVLASEFGLEPGPALQRLEMKILAQRPELDWRFQQPPAAPPSSEGAAEAGIPPLVGRDAELATIDGALTAAQGGQGRVLLVTGEPGSGRTRLLEELAGRAAASGFEVAQGQCYEGDGAPAFWPWSQILREVVRAASDTELQKAAGLEARQVARLVPDLAVRLPGTVALGPPSNREPDRFRLYDAVSVFLARFSARQPLLLLLDDLHRADTASLRLLLMLAKEARRARLVIAAAYHEAEARGSRPLAEVLAGLAREPGVERLALHGLDLPAVAAYLAGALGQPAAEVEELARQVHRRSGGNPFFVAELVRLQTDGSGGPVPSSVPRGVSDVIRRRVQHLPADADEVLAAAAVASHGASSQGQDGAGFEFTVGLVQGCCQLPGEQVIEVLDAAAAAGLLDEETGVAGRYRFTQELVRETLYEQLPSALRMRLHALVGELLEDAPLEPAERELRLAHHFCLAAPVGTADKAVAHTRQAASQALGRRAYAEAVALLERAVEATEAAAFGDDDACCDLLVDLGHARQLADDPEGARAALRAAAALARRIGALGKLPRAAFDI